MEGYLDFPNKTNSVQPRSPFKEVIMTLRNDKIQKIGEYFRTNIPREDLLAKIDEGPVALQIYIWNQTKHL